MKRLAAIAVLALVALPAFAQDQTISELMTKHWKTSKDFTLAVAQIMPDTDYSFKPHPEEMSFGEVMTHIGMANANYVARAAGEKNPFTRPKESDKATAIKFLTETYDYCVQKLAAISNDTFGKMSGPEGRQMSGTEAAWAGFTHAAHHRGQAEVYLRVKNLKPPAYTF